MIPPKYKFYISKNDGDKVEVRPHYKELNKKYAKESGQEFFRISLDGKINLFGTDYEIVSQSNIEDQLVFIIDKYNSTSKNGLNIIEVNLVRLIVNSTMIRRNVNLKLQQ